jgi:hypothetical protein
LLHRFVDLRGNVAERGHVTPACLSQETQDVAAAVAGTDDAHGDAIIRAEDARVGGGGLPRRLYRPLKSLFA